MAYAPFVHLRVHTAYSLSEGAIKVEALLKLCRENAMPAVAMTDSGNLFGALDFSSAAKDMGIQPIIGCTLNLRRESEDSRQLKTPDPDKIVVLAQNEEGYLNLLKLVSKAFLETTGGETPQVSFSDLKTHAHGLLLLTGGAEGPIGRLLLHNHYSKAEEFLLRLKQAFPGRLYIEIMRHGMPSEIKTEPDFLKLAYGHDIPLVATNQVFFAYPEMYEAHDALLCISDGAFVSQPQRRRVTAEHYFKSASQMLELFADLPEAVNNSLVVAQRCAFLSPKRDPILPPYPQLKGRSEEDALREIAFIGLDRRLESHLYTPEMDDHARERAAKPYKERLDYELTVISKMGFCGYFLIVADFIQWSKAQGIPVGPGRGSGAGSLVAYALTITDLDPLRWGLLFERFLNPERVSMPDFDIDFCQDRRDEVISYMQKTYGKDKMAQIITFGQFQARAVLRDVGRVLEMPYGQVDRLCKLVPNPPGKPVKLKDAIAGEPQLQKARDEEENVARMLDIGQELEGLYRHASTHAAGVVIGDRPLDELVPLYRDPRSDIPVTQFSMKWAESAGLVKFDFLGLKTLTVMAKAIALSKQNIDLATLDLTDQPAYAVMAKGETVGIFQLESSGMRDVLRKMRPDKLEDIIAVVALYRPGPMANIPNYIKRKHGEEEPDYLHPLLEPILKETFGIMVYQEQVMQIAQVLSGYSLGAADLLRRAMGKKKKEEMDAQRKIFVEGAVAKGVPENQASDIFELMAKFADYGFNKSHAAAYALIAFQTAWLKAHYPVEFMAASMTYEMHSTDKLDVFRQELERMKIKLLPPCINSSQADFAVENGAVRYALAAIKNVGAEAMRALVDEREKNGLFKDITDLAERMDSKAINRRQLENLIKAGALDCLEKNRFALFESIDLILRHASTVTSERNSNQNSLFGSSSGVKLAKLELKEVADWKVIEKLDQEHAAIGFFLSAHPLDSFGKSLERLGVLRSCDVVGYLSNGGSSRIKLAGILSNKQERTSAKGNRFAFLSLSDAGGAYEVTVFSEVLGAVRELLTPGRNLLISADARLEEEQLKLMAVGIETLEEAASKTGAGLRVVLSGPEAIISLRNLLAKVGRGKGRVVVVPQIPGYAVEMSLKQAYSISPAVLNAVRDIKGVSEVVEI